MCEGRKTSQVDCPGTTHFDFFKKFKFLKPLDPKPGVLGCFLVTVSLICCLFLFDYRLVNGFHGGSFFRSWFRPDSSLLKPGFLDISDEDCNIFDGNWVWDENYPLYQPQGCMFLDGGFRCNENGRPDNLYTKWRWQPKDCILPRFDAKLMLEKLRNKRVAFVGDSIGRNQWESLLCMLSSAVTNKSSIYEVNGNPITKHSGSLVFKFGEFNCTVEYHRAPFLVSQSRPPIGSKQGVKLTLKLDQMDWSSRKWKNADLLVLNTGHWWNYEKTIKAGCYFQEGTEVKEEMSIETAFRRSMKTIMDWSSRKLNLTTTHLILRTYAPVHFSGGDWKHGGSCHRETMPNFGSTKALSEAYPEFKTMIEVFTKHPVMRNITLLNVTSMTSSRRDGHSSVYYLGPNGISAAMNRQDCSHWCLPGVPDSWNELLYAVFLKREISSGLNQTKPMHS